MAKPLEIRQEADLFLAPLSAAQGLSSLFARNIKAMGEKKTPKQKVEHRSAPN